MTDLSQEKIKKKDKREEAYFRRQKEREKAR
jgi:hypothetical protein